jgi:hypothetical protein
MFSSGPNYNKLKTNLRLSCNRLKLLEKKKTETNQKARKEIAGKFLKMLQIPRKSSNWCSIFGRFLINQQTGPSANPC